MSLENQIQFLIEIDRLKSVIRQSPLIDNSRRENSAEHSWHLAMAAMLLYEHASEPVDVKRAIEMALVHDIAEILAGDTFVYDENGRGDQHARERSALDELTANLPLEQKTLIIGLWEEYEHGATAEARFVYVIDRLLPILANHKTGGSWVRHNIKKSQAMEKIKAVKTICPSIYDYMTRLLDEAEDKGFLQK